MKRWQYHSEKDAVKMQSIEFFFPLALKADVSVMPHASARLRSQAGNICLFTFSVLLRTDSMFFPE